ncbi:MAG: Fic family protein [Bacteroidia bacterium]|nr:Fic family protein [Bacteroidia bacterium]
MKNQFSQEVSAFRGRRMPERGCLVGYALLLQVIEDQTSKRLPLPAYLSMSTTKHRRYTRDNWHVFTIRHQPGDDLKSHIVFSLKYEGIDLQILKETFKLIGPKSLTQMIMDEPTGQYSRRIWFLYEWMFIKPLDIPDLMRGTYVDIVDDNQQYCVTGKNSTRHRVRNNLPGTAEFCPLIRKTKKLESLIEGKLDDEIRKGLRSVHNDLLRRTAAFLLLKDSKASFHIEGEKPSPLRARNWGAIIGSAGKHQLTIEEIERLQQIVIGKDKLRHMGIRHNHEGFIGEHDSEDFTPIPEHISAKSKDLPDLMKGLFETNEILQKSEYHPILTAATIAFGFVYIHPLADGNGRIHRYIIHHILAKQGFADRNIIFPISASILDHLATYQDVLEHHSSPRLELIDWESTDDYNTRILNDTKDLYRYYDNTLEAEFLFDCVQYTIDRVIPSELDYLMKYDELTDQINNLVTMENTRVDLMIKFIHQNDGRLSKTKREKYFGFIEDDQIRRIETQYQAIFKPGSEE